MRTIFHGTHIPLQKWFFALSLLTFTGSDRSIRQLAHDLEVSKNTASYLSLRVYRAMLRSSERQLLETIVKDIESLIASTSNAASEETT